MLEKIQLILEDQLLGLYIAGSIASNSFNEETSDIDCYVITRTKLTSNMIDKLEKMHEEFCSSKSRYAKRIEASYIPQSDLLKFDPSTTRPYFNEGKFYLASYGNNFLIELFILREMGITILGPELKEPIKEISKQDLRQAIKKNLYEYWEPLLNNLAKLNRSDYQVFAILTMCRTLYSLETGAITSKIKAAQSVINRAPQRKFLIEKALDWSAWEGTKQIE